MAGPGAYLRLLRAGWSLTRAGLFGLLEDAAPGDTPLVARVLKRLGPRGGKRARGPALRSALVRLGPSWVKLGQFLGTRGDVVGPEVADALSQLKDEMAPFPIEEARRTIEASTGQPADAIFDKLSAPVAAASIAQVHRGVLRDGRTVAVKVLRPGIRRRFRQDIDSYYAAARRIEAWSPEARRLRPVAVVETLERSMMLETDFRIEAAAMSEMAENTADDAGFRVPTPDWALTGRDLLVSEWVDGIKLSDLAGLDAAGLDRKALAAGVVQHFLRHAIRDGLFHADMHEGNLFADRGGDIVAVDFGIMGRIGPAEQRFLAEILYGFIRRDYRRIAEVHFEAGYVPRNHGVQDFAQALRAIGEPIHGVNARDISMAKLLGLLFEITDLFDMQTRTELVLLQKTMVVVEGVARRLDPDFDMWRTAEPIVKDWIARNLGPAGRLGKAAEGAGEIGRFLGHVPGLLTRAETLAAAVSQAAESGFRLDGETVRAIGRSEARHARSGRIALWVIAALLAIIAFG
ncbi:MAG: 2-polyprenylphenol 6-hydroxylase [Flavobacteriaceae bacterium]